MLRGNERVGRKLEREEKEKREWGPGAAEISLRIEPFSNLSLTFRVSNFRRILRRVRVTTREGREKEKKGKGGNVDGW